MKKLLTHLAASYLRALAAVVGALQIVTHGYGIGIAVDRQVLATAVGSLLAPTLAFMLGAADLIDNGADE